MNIRDLEYLVALDELRNFRKASERCHVTQPTLSGQLRKLEEHLGVLLVERTKRKVILTPVGKEVVRRARMILQEVEQIEGGHAVQNVGENGRGSLSQRECNRRLETVRQLVPYQDTVGLRRRHPQRGSGA